MGTIYRGDQSLHSIIMFRWVLAPAEAEVSWPTTTYPLLPQAAPAFS